MWLTRHRIVDPVDVTDNGGAQVQGAVNDNVDGAVNDQVHVTVRDRVRPLDTIADDQ